MAMLTHCFFCKKAIVVPSGSKTYKLADYDYEDLRLFEEYKQKTPYVLIGEYCCESCFNRKILPNLIQ